MADPDEDKTAIVADSLCGLPLMPLSCPSLGAPVAWLEVDTAVEGRAVPRGEAERSKVSSIYAARKNR